MEKILHSLRCEIEEYSSLFKTSGSRQRGEIDWDEIEKELNRECEWTPEGAETLLDLARQYGSSVLTNALALSMALGIEDGELGL